MSRSFQAVVADTRLESFSPSDPIGAARTSTRTRTTAARGWRKGLESPELYPSLWTALLIAFRNSLPARRMPGLIIPSLVAHGLATREAGDERWLW